MREKQNLVLHGFFGADLYTIYWIENAQDRFKC